MLKYQELVNTLLDELANGVYKKGDRLPTTPELCERYGVSNTTVKRAMDELELQGIVARERHHHSTGQHLSADVGYDSRI